MIIKSNFKDYYDFVSHQFGGGDPNVVYERKRLRPLVTSATLSYDEGFSVSEFKVLDLPYQYTRRDDKIKFKWLIIAGKYYLLVNEFGNFEVFNEIKHAHLEKKYSHFEIEHNIGYASNKLVELSKHINAPVFCIRDTGRRSHEIIIDGEIPILSTLGIPQIIPAFQIYQDIGYFITNTMHSNPDIDTPVVVSEKDRIVGHGFDLKKSFRHRK